jgi:hypothetical protein
MATGVSFFRKTTIIIGILVSLVAGIAPIYWDYFKESKRLTLELISDVNLISKDDKIDGLKVIYHNKEIQQLRQITYRLSNTGRSEILKEEISIPLTVNLHDTNLVTYRIDDVEPDYIKSSINITYDAKSNNIIVSFEDLKNSEMVLFSIFLDGEIHNPLDAHIRVKGIADLETINHVQKIEEEKEKRGEIFTKRHTWVLFLLWPAFVFCFLVMIFFILARNGHQRMNNMIANGFNVNSLTYTELPAFLTKHMNSWMDDNRKERIQAIMSENGNDEETKRIKIITEIESEITDNSYIYGAFTLW